MATDLTIMMEDRPGGLANVGEALGNAGINIEGVSGVAHDGRGIIHVCVMDGAAARAALEAAGLDVTGETEAILTQPFGGSDEPGALGKMARAVADAEVNVRAMYLATNDRGVIVTDNNAMVESMIAKMT